MKLFKKFTFIFLSCLSMVAYGALTPEQQRQLNDKLLNAAERGDLPKVEQAIADGANVHANYALIGAAQEGHWPIVQYLVEHGANIHALDDLTLQWAVVKGYLPIVEYLLEHGANIHANNDQALRCATSFRHWAVTACLLQYGADRTKLTAWLQQRLQQYLCTSAQVHNYILAELRIALSNNDWQAAERVLGIVPVQELPTAIQEKIEHVIAHAALGYIRQRELGSSR